jgi:hypothetical protein
VCGKGTWASTTRRRAARKTARPAPGLTAWSQDGGERHAPRERLEIVRAHAA